MKKNDTDIIRYFEPNDLFVLDRSGGKTLEVSVLAKTKS